MPKDTPNLREKFIVRVQGPSNKNVWIISDARPAKRSKTVMEPGDKLADQTTYLGVSRSSGCALFAAATQDQTRLDWEGAQQHCQQLSARDDAKWSNMTPAECQDIGDAPMLSDRIWTNRIDPFYGIIVFSVCAAVTHEFNATRYSGEPTGWRNVLDTHKVLPVKRLKTFDHPSQINSI